MNLLTHKISEFLPDWNERVHTEADAYAFCERNQIITIETDLISDLGEYRTYKEKPFIFLHKFIDERFRNWVLHHEIGHFILHPATCAHFSDEVQKRKIEKEANFVSAVSLMPRHILEDKTLAEIQEEFGYPRKIILYRKFILDSCKI